jgi:hypothetical protein
MDDQLWHPRQRESSGACAKEKRWASVSAAVADIIVRGQTEGNRATGVRPNGPGVCKYKIGRAVTVYTGCFRNIIMAFGSSGNSSRAVELTEQCRINVRGIALSTGNHSPFIISLDWHYDRGLAARQPKRVSSGRWVEGEQKQSRIPKLGPEVSSHSPGRSHFSHQSTLHIPRARIPDIL